MTKLPQVRSTGFKCLLFLFPADWKWALESTGADVSDAATEQELNIIIILFATWKIACLLINIGQ